MLNEGYSIGRQFPCGVFPILPFEVVGTNRIGLGWAEGKIPEETVVKIRRGQHSVLAWVGS